MDGSLSSAACASVPPVSAQLPSGWWKNASSRAAARSRPPIAWNSPAMLCWTIQVYWPTVPSAKPSNDDGLDAGQLPSMLRLVMYPPVASTFGLNTFCQYCERVMNSSARRGSPVADSSCASAKSSVESSSVSPAPPHAFDCADT